MCCQPGVRGLPAAALRAALPRKGLRDSACLKSSYESSPKFKEIQFCKYWEERIFYFMVFRINIHCMHDAVLGGTSFQSVSENLYFVGASE